MKGLIVKSISAKFLLKKLKTKSVYQKKKERKKETGKNTVNRGETLRKTLQFVA